MLNKYLTNFVVITASATLWAASAPAQGPMSGAQFDTATKGKTFYYGSGGKPYGAEQYLDKQRVRWSFLDGKCKEGLWFEENGLICFIYEDNLDPQCWSFQKGGAGGLVAHFQNKQAQTTLYEMKQSDKPMKCMGPDVGV